MIGFGDAVKVSSAAGLSRRQLLKGRRRCRISPQRHHLARERAPSRKMAAVVVAIATVTPLVTKRKRKVPKVKRLKSQRKKARRRRRKRLSFLLRAKATSPLPNPTTVICSLYQFTKISYFLMVNSQYGWN